MFNYASITKKGSELLSQSVAGKTLVFTRMEYGNGVLEALKTITSETEIKALFFNVTALVSKKADIGIYSTKTSSNTTTLTGKIINSSISEDFRAKELGVFAKIDGGTEVLFAYFSAVDYLSGKENDISDFISQSALLGQEHKVVVNVATGNAANITIEYNPEIYATKEEFDVFVEQNAADHQTLENKIKSIDISSQLTDVYNAVNEEVSTRSNADITLQKNIDNLATSVDEKIGNIDISASLKKTLQFDHVVDSDESLLAWANCTDKSMKNVLVKSGTYSLSGKMINLVSAGTKFIFGEDGNKINISAYDRGIGATANYGAVVIGLNVSVVNSTYSSKEIDGVFYRGMTCINCKGTGNSSGNIEGIFNQCSCIDCISSATATGTKADYYSCKGLVSFSFDKGTATLTIDTD